MTGQEIRDRAENGILDGETFNDDDFFIMLLNVAKNDIEDSREWIWLRKKVSSFSTNSSDTYLTTHVLASDVKIVRSMTVGGVKFDPIDLEELETRKDEANHYWVDYVNGTWGLTGTNESGLQIVYWYTYNSPDITLSTSWVFPDKYHPLLAFNSAGYYQGGVDIDDIYAKMSPENKNMALTIKRMMINWDAGLQESFNNHSTVGQSRSDVSFMN